MFEHMSVKITNGQKKPNKAIMLLSVIELIRCGYIVENKIYIEDTIQEAFEHTWKKYIDDNPPTGWTPFWHLNSEPFWHFKPMFSYEAIESITKPGETAALSKMKSTIKYAYLDDELYDLLVDKTYRTNICEVLQKLVLGNNDFSRAKSATQ